MKKIGRYLFILTLSSAALSGCDFFSDFETETNVKALELRDYKTAVVINKQYEFGGKVILQYNDNTEKDVTSKSTFPTLDTSKLGTYPYKVSYETTNTIYTHTVKIAVVEKIKLESIEVTDYSAEVFASTTDSYTFDGKIYAVYTDSTKKDVTSEASITKVDISKIGSQQLTVSFTEDGVTKTATKEISVIKKLESISISLQKSTLEVNTEFSFVGKVLAVYSDGSSEDITSSAKIDSSGINMSEIGNYTLKASYEAGGQTFTTSCPLAVAARIPVLEKITASDYTPDCLKNSAYTFNGKVTASFDEGPDADVTAFCTFSKIDTSKIGNKTLTISYTDTNSEKTKTLNIIIEVYNKVSSISAPTTLNVATGKSKTLSASAEPSDARNTKLNYSSENESVATIDSNGLVTAKAKGSSIITISSDEDPSITAQTTVVVDDSFNAKWTILLYLCGADLESDNGLATSDINEILSVKNQPEDVNFVIQTGGSSRWHTSTISSKYNQRYHIENQKLISDDSQVYSSYKSMGLTSTLQDFIEWGINKYPADNTGLILWNHGGGMQGVCFDYKTSNQDSLLTEEVVSAVSCALDKTGLSGQKLEFIGYDACLMQVQDIASKNAKYFNYMIASEESEAGEGWDYDNWVDDLYNKKATTTILKAVVDSFIQDNGGTSSSNNDQTLSYLDLSYMDAYVTAWNNMSKQLAKKITSSNKTSFNNLVKSVKYYADTDYLYYGLFDAKDFINKLASNSTFNPGSEYTNAVLTAHSNLVGYNSKGRGAGNSFGVALFWAVSTKAEADYYYTEGCTELSDWRALVTEFGN